MNFCNFQMQSGMSPVAVKHSYVFAWTIQEQKSNILHHRLKSLEDQKRYIKFPWNGCNTTYRALRKNKLPISTKWSTNSIKRLSYAFKENKIQTYSWRNFFMRGLISRTYWQNLERLVSPLKTVIGGLGYKLHTF